MPKAIPSKSRGGMKECMACGLWPMHNVYPHTSQVPVEALSQDPTLLEKLNNRGLPSPKMKRENEIEKKDEETMENEKGKEREKHEETWDEEKEGERMGKVERIYGWARQRINGVEPTLLEFMYDISEHLKLPENEPREKQAEEEKERRKDDEDWAQYEEEYTKGYLGNKEAYFKMKRQMGYLDGELPNLERMKREWDFFIAREINYQRWKGQTPEERQEEMLRGFKRKECLPQHVYTAIYWEVPAHERQRVQEAFPEEFKLLEQTHSHNFMGNEEAYKRLKEYLSYEKWELPEMAMLGRLWDDWVKQETELERRKTQNNVKLYQGEQEYMECESPMESET